MCMYGGCCINCEHTILVLKFPWKLAFSKFSFINCFHLTETYKCLCTLVHDIRSHMKSICYPSLFTCISIGSLCNYCVFMSRSRYTIKLKERELSSKLMVIKMVSMFTLVAIAALHVSYGIFPFFVQVVLDISGSMSSQVFNE